MLNMMKLVLSVKRRVHRRQDSRASVANADAGLAAKRPGVLSRNRMTCSACGYQAKEARHLDVHHADDDHTNNDDKNLVLGCHTCHPYQHVGELARRDGQGDVSVAEGLGQSSRIATIPEIEAADMNLLQRVLGVARMDPEERKYAAFIYNALRSRVDATEEIFRTSAPTDFALIMHEALDDEDYAQRHEVLGDQRLIFSVAHLDLLGKEFVADNPTLPMSAWSAAAAGVVRQSQAQQEQ